VLLLWLMSLLLQDVLPAAAMLGQATSTGRLQQVQACNPYCRKHLQRLLSAL
jgi:hypothetical protein